MADRLTQLQDAVDNLLDLMIDSINYNQDKHPHAPITGQPVLEAPAPPGAAPKTNGDADAKKEAGDADAPKPETPEAFEAMQREMAKKIVLQEQQAEIITNSLPGLGSSEAKQMRRLAELKIELEDVQRERDEAEKGREFVLSMLTEALVGIKRVP
ncbi:hypothetical protein EJ03DRAFT_356414 [Teratosphaeria nubilosa]|uniref:Mediator of RNA polymerase II transcription subunit 21 n=1 Tax=Teratosphaeria nubilosa TaxID=161662 RepID=A0A6G1KUC6_9PEZI|nr:hypothetical protein EJ03DRAFT_356414 [Teratosphaeria nubilosa]